MKNLLKSILLTLALTTLSACSNNLMSEETAQKEEVTYEDYKEFELSSLDEFYTMSNSSYYIYLYSDVCPHCEDIKSTVFTYLNRFKDGDVKTPLYIFNMHSLKSTEGIYNRSHFKSKDENLGLTQEQLINEMKNNKPSLVSETYFIGTPSLYKIESRHYGSMYIGNSDVKNQLRNVAFNVNDYIISISFVVGCSILSLILLSFCIKSSKKYYL